MRNGYDLRGFVTTASCEDIEWLVRTSGVRIRAADSSPHTRHNSPQLRHNADVVTTSQFEEGSVSGMSAPVPVSRENTSLNTFL
jgi:hypothetical protein